MVDYPLIIDREYEKKFMKGQATNDEEFDLEYVDFGVKLIKHV